MVTNSGTHVASIADCIEQYPPCSCFPVPLRWIYARVGNTVEEDATADVSMNAILAEVAHSQPREARIIQALFDEVCEGWARLHDALEGNLLIDACQAKQMFPKISGEASLQVFIKMSGTSLERCPPVSHAVVQLALCK